MLSTPRFSRLGVLVVKVRGGWADTTGLGHWVVPEGMLFLGHAVPLVVVRSGNGVRGQFIRWTALLGASASSGATPTPGYTAKGVARTTWRWSMTLRRTRELIARPRPCGSRQGQESTDPALSSSIRMPVLPWKRGA